jgi:hypothetical protein
MYVYINKYYKNIYSSLGQWPHGPTMWPWGHVLCQRDSSCSLDHVFDNLNNRLPKDIRDELDKAKGYSQMLAVLRRDSARCFPDNVKAFCVKCNEDCPVFPTVLTKDGHWKAVPSAPASAFHNCINATRSLLLI